MDPREFPTKGNLIAAKNSLALAKQGYDLMDKKRNILIRELMDLIDEAKDIQEEIDTTLQERMHAFRGRISNMGISKVEELAYTVPIEDSIQIQTRSIMGTEIPYVKYDAHENQLTYAMMGHLSQLILQEKRFGRVKGSDDQAFYGGKCSLSVGNEY